jgi:hypothetical protein
MGKVLPLGLLRELCRVMLCRGLPPLLTSFAGIVSVMPRAVCAILAAYHLVFATHFRSPLIGDSE